MTLLPRRTARSAGFTLIEVMVAVGLTAVMLWGLLQLFTSATRFSSAVTTETELCAAGRAALERMCYELSQAALPSVAYLYIDSDGSGFDTLRFVAPVGEGGKSYLHVRYRAIGSGTTRTLVRATNSTPEVSRSSRCTSLGRVFFSKLS